MKLVTVVVGLVAAAAILRAQPPGRGGPPQWGPRVISAEAGRTGPVVKNAPFSAEVVTETTQTLSNGDHIHQTSTSHIYRDSEGRTRREQSLNGLGALAPNGNLPPVVFINDPVAGANYALSPSDHTATRSTGGRGFGQMGRGPQKQDASVPGRRGRGPQVAADRPNVKSESLPRQTIEGVPADGSRTTMTIPVGQLGNEQPIQIVTETWYSPDLQINVLSRRSDPRSGETVTRYNNVMRIEPAHSLFEVPADYKVTEAAGRGSATK